MTYVSIHVCVAVSISSPCLILLLLHMLALCSSLYEYEHTNNHHHALCVRSGPPAVDRCVHTLRTDGITMTIRPPTSSLDVEVWIPTHHLETLDHDQSCSQVSGCWRSLAALHR